jgi:hypothetical protein
LKEGESFTFVQRIEAPFGLAFDLAFAFEKVHSQPKDQALGTSGSKKQLSSGSFLTSSFTLLFSAVETSFCVIYPPPVSCVLIHVVDPISWCVS